MGAAAEVQADTVPLVLLHVVVQVLGVRALALTARALEVQVLDALTPVVTLEIPARVDIRGLTLAAPVHRATLVTPVLRATQGLVLAAPTHVAIPILTQATQDLRVTLILIQVIPTRRVIQTRAQAVLITTTATATITTTTITMTTMTTTTITTAITTARD